VVLLPVQRWLLEQDQPGVHQVNQSEVLDTRGLDPVVLDRALAVLVEHHDMLRSRFTRGDAGWVQEIPAGRPAGMVTYRDLAGLSPADRDRGWLELAGNAQAGMDLERGELVRAVLARLGPDGQQRLLIAIHHLVVDAVSWPVLLEDLGTACRQLSSGQPARLPAKTTSFQAWSARLADYARSPQALAEAGYWTRPRQAGPLPGLTRPAATAAEAVSSRVTLSGGQTSALLRQAPAAFGASVEDILLAALAIAVSRWSRQHHVLIDVEGHGREPLFEDIDLTRTVGWFTTMHPLELAAPPGADLAQIVGDTAARRQAVPHKGIGYGILARLADQPIREQLAAQPPADIVFNYLGSQRATSGGLGTPSRAPHGPQVHPGNPLPYPVEINADITDGIFTADIITQPGPQASALAAHYTSALADLIDHTSDTVLGNRQFTYASTDRDDLMKIASRLQGS
jgi:non-ribosomal peptide synthase protein (TIGR01720 family)